jgi:hypothetical protein
VKVADLIVREICETNIDVIGAEAVEQLSGQLPVTGLTCVGKCGIVLGLEAGSIGCRIGVALDEDWSAAGCLWGGTLLRDMRQFVSEQTATGFGRSVGGASEGDVRAEGVSAGTDTACGVCGAAVVVNADGGEIDAKSRLKEGAIRCGKGMAGGTNDFVN